MENEPLLGAAQRYLEKLCVTIGERPVGSDGNRQATAFFAETVTACSFAVERPAFDCIDWRDGGASLHVGSDSFAVFASPYSKGAHVTGPLAAVASVEALAKSEVRGKVLLLHGEIAAEQLMPKNFPFYNPEHHQQIVSLLEQAAPLAIVCATGRDAQLAGGMYPFPLIEDGDFDIPSVYMTDVEGARLLAHIGQRVQFESMAQRVKARGENVAARKGDSRRRIVVCAHIDAKIGTPGAIDNGGGVVVLLLLAQLLADYKGVLGVELLAFDGEDYYSAPGQQLYLAQHANELGQITLVINIDGVGYRTGKTAYSLYGCEEAMAQRVRQTFDAHAGLLEGPAWYQGDHAIFVQQGIPALALTSEAVWELTTSITHTAKDTVEIVDASKLVETAGALRLLLRALEDRADT